MWEAERQGVIRVATWIKLRKRGGKGSRRRKHIEGDGVGRAEAIVARIILKGGQEQEGGAGQGVTMADA